MYSTPIKIEVTDCNIVNKLASIITSDIKSSYYAGVPSLHLSQEKVRATSFDKLDVIRSSPHKDKLESDRLAIKILECVSLSRLQEWVEQQYPDYIFNISNTIIYPPGGYIGWHTNANQVGLRLYLHWVENVGQSSFKYWDGSQVVDDTENEKCFMRIFRITDAANPFWHCVDSNTWRVSIGFYMEAKQWG